MNQRIKACAPYSLWIAVGLGVATAACGKDDGGAATLSFGLMSTGSLCPSTAPNPGVNTLSHAYIVVDRVEVQMSGNWLAVRENLGEKVDLLALDLDAVDLGVAGLPPGDLDAVRLTIDRDRAPYVVTTEGRTLPLKVPTDQQGGLVMSGAWFLAGCDASQVSMDIDASHSIWTDPRERDLYVFSPTMQTSQAHAQRDGCTPEQDDFFAACQVSAGSGSAVQGHKTTICHIPPGNPANAHTITVGNPAVPAHLAHGDHIGSCGCAGHGHGHGHGSGGNGGPGAGNNGGNNGGPGGGSNGHGNGHGGNNGTNGGDGSNGGNGNGTTPPGWNNPNNPHHTDMNPPTGSGTNPPSSGGNGSPDPGHGSNPPGTASNPPNGGGTIPPNSSTGNPPDGTGGNPPTGTPTIPPPGEGQYPPANMCMGPPDLAMNPPNGTNTTPPNGSGSLPPPGSSTYPPPDSGSNSPPNGSGTNPPPNDTGNNPPPSGGGTPDPGMGSTPPVNGTTPNGGPCTQQSDCMIGSFCSTSTNTCITL